MTTSDTIRLFKRREIFCHACQQPIRLGGHGPLPIKADGLRYHFQCWSVLKPPPVVSRPVRAASVSDMYPAEES